MKNNLDIILGFAMLIGIAYRVFQIETAIYDAIEDLKESVSNKINSLEPRFALHIAIYAERKEQVDYLLHAIVKGKIDHKANRLFDEIKAD